MKTTIVIPREGVESDVAHHESPVSGDVVIPREGVERISNINNRISLLSPVIPREGVESVKLALETPEILRNPVIPREGVESALVGTDVRVRQEKSDPERGS